MFGLSFASLALKLGTSERTVKFGLIALAIVLLVIGAGVAKCSYDRSVVNNATAKQTASNAIADRKADTHAGNTRRTDDARLTQESQQLEKVQAHAQTDLDRRLARARCLRAQQAARAGGREPPACT
jgi:hypothetical protein